MIDSFFGFLKAHLVPGFIFNSLRPAYHYLLALAGALIYGFPSHLRQRFDGQTKKMKIIGVTGTKGKTTTCYLIAQILNSCGFKTGTITTALLKIGEREWTNDSKQTMPGRFQLQKLLAQMRKEACHYAVIETSSEGILQYRHRFVDYDMAIFTNLSPEHIERHGSFENYRNAKIKLFEKVAEKDNGVGIYNLDDENVGYFLEPRISERHSYTLKLRKPIAGIQNLHKISRIETTRQGASFLFGGESADRRIETPLIGEFNVYNAAAAICAALSQDIPFEKIKTALAAAKPPPGRFEIVDKGQDFKVIIDYAHEPASLEAAYKAIKNSKFQIPDSKSKLICLLGAQGGGRDKWKRSAMGKIAAQYCDKIILTNEDPYDENPRQILSDIKSGIQNSKFEIKNLYEIIDRKEAVEKSFSLAKKGDVVILTGKGGESWMCVENGKKIAWDERKTVEEILSQRKWQN